jgi:hypothetical protein
MNHSPSGSLFLSKAIPGFINYKTAEGLALRTIDSTAPAQQNGFNTTGTRNPPSNPSPAQRMLKPAFVSRVARPSTSRSLIHAPAFSYRDQAIILTLLDTACAPWSCANC